MRSKTELNEVVVKVTNDTKIKHIANMRKGKVIVDVQPGMSLKYLDMRDILENPSVERLNYQSPKGDFRTIDGILYRKNKLVRCPAGRTGAIVIPEGITDIMDSAFIRCGISSIKFPKSLKCIRDYAFSSCLSLGSVDFGYGIQNIGDYAFCECIKLKEITIPSQVLSIGDCAFKNCGLRQVSLPERIPNIGEGTFLKCLSLKEMECSNTFFKCYFDTYSIGLHYVHRVVVSELTDRTIILHDSDSKGYNSGIVEIVTPDDTFYISKYMTKMQCLALTCDKIKSPDFLDYKYSTSIDIGDYATVKRYLYLIESGRKVSGKVKSRIIKRWKNIIQFLIQKNDTETLLKLVKTDIARADKVEYALQEVSDVTLKAYVLEELSKKEKKTGFDI